MQHICHWSNLPPPTNHQQSASTPHRSSMADKSESSCSFCWLSQLDDDHTNSTCNSQHNTPVVCTSTAAAHEWQWRGLRQSFYTVHISLELRILCSHLSPFPLSPQTQLVTIVQDNGASIFIHLNRQEITFVLPFVQHLKRRMVQEVDFSFNQLKRPSQVKWQYRLHRVQLNICQWMCTSFLVKETRDIQMTLVCHTVAEGRVLKHYQYTRMKRHWDDQACNCLPLECSCSINTADKTGEYSMTMCTNGWAGDQRAQKHNST